MTYKILVVDNEFADLECTRMVLEEDSDFEITGILDSNEAIQLIKEKPNYFAVVLMDYRMPKDGISTAKEMLEINPYLVIAMNSADDSRDVLKKCMAIGVKDFIEKSQDEDIVRGIVRSLCQRWEETAELYHEASSEIEKQKIMSSIGLVGQSDNMVKVAQLVHAAAKSASSVFINGESGTGKELIAKAIHNLSDRKNKPFIPVNVNAIPDNLIESHLFGHKKGAFTGAIADNEGLIKSAHKGTLFLDEIGDLKPDLQVKLLRVLQDRKLTPVGSNIAFDVDIRIISATHVNLDRAILEGKFREDLYYRLHVLPIKIPALRERRNDIGLLFNHFLKVYKGTDVVVLKNTIRCLESYSWKGNVRELQNEVERLVAGQIKRILPQDLNSKIRNSVNIEVHSENGQNYQDFKINQHEEELEYINSSIRKMGSLREASRSLLKLAPSSIVTRVKILEKNITNLKLKSIGGENYE